MRGVLACVVCLGLSAGAAAQPALDPQLIEPSAGRVAGVSLPDPALLSHGAIAWGAHFGYARRTLRLACLQPGECPQDAGGLGTVLHSQTALSLSLAVGLADVFELGVVAGGGLTRAAGDATMWRDPRWAIGLGDVRLLGKLRVLDVAAGGLEVAALAELTIPTGAEEDYLGARGWGVAPGLVAGARIGVLSATSLVAYDMRQATTLGGLELDDELRAAVAFDVALTATLGLLLETQLRAGLGGDTRDADEHPVESQLGARIDLGSALRLRVALGTGVWPAPEGYGTSDYRVVVDLRGVRDAAACALGPEDVDGYRDGDRCADPDNDGDGILDGRDVCPNDAEDVDGFADADGCPDLDNDADGVLDAVDRCPEQSEDGDGHQDADGCPEPDNDSDGIADVDDACPMDPEDRDDYQDGDGCPEPGPQRLAITVTDTRILVSERVYFEYDSEVIRPVSMPTLDEVARAILALGGERGVRIEGHTDAAGDANYNLDLSFRRARSVLEYLVSRGVTRQRLSHIGHGGQRPLAEGASPEARALNRRVEFAISTDSPPRRLDNSPNSGE